VATWTTRRTIRRLSLPDQWCPVALRAHWHRCLCGLASGASSPRRLMSSLPDFSLDDDLALLVLPSLGRSLSHTPSLKAAPFSSRSAVRLPGATVQRRNAVSGRQDWLLPLGHFRKGPVLGPTPCASKFQRAGKLALPLPRLPAPRGLCPRLRCRQRSVGALDSPSLSGALRRSRGFGADFDAASSLRT
jgi:hypothetical protein